MQERSTDAQVMRRSCRQPELFEAIFERHFATVYRYLRRRTGDASAEELAAETFLRAFGSRERYRAHSDSALPWLFGIATNLMLEQARRQARQERAYQRAAAEIEFSEDDRSVDRLSAVEDARLIRDAISALPSAQREVLLLHAWAELSSEEIGEAMAIPAATARSRLSRARAAVTAALTESATESETGGEKR
jgi:RNA polymerase sigma-70 factor (ECF subfamily)